MPTVDGVASAHTMLSWGTCNPGYCLHYVWQAYKAHGARSSGSYPTAYSAWLASSGKHEGDWNAPAGVPVYFGPKASSNAGDVVISLGGGMCAATDWPRNGVIGTCSLADRQRQISRPYLGWCDNILGNPIAGLAPEPEPEQVREWDMLIFQIQTWDGGGVNGQCYALSSGSLYICRDAEEAKMLASHNNPGGQLIAIKDADLLVEFDARGIPRDAVNLGGGVNGSWAKRAATNTEPAAAADFATAVVPER